MAENVAIFVDYDNVYWSLMKNHNHNPDHDDKTKNLFEQLWTKYGRDNIRTFRVYADFEKIDTNLTSLQKKRLQIRHVYSNGKDGTENKNSSDIELSIDAIETTYKDDTIKRYVFVTADSDMVPVLSRMMYKGKNVDLYYLSKAISPKLDLDNYVHYSEKLEDFLSIEIQEYDIKDYILSGLKFIKSWQTRNAGKNKFLGKKWLKDDLQKELAIPGNTVSDLIEYLLAQEFIFEDRKNIGDGLKTNINLTDAGEKILKPEDSPEVSESPKPVKPVEAPVS